MNGRAGRSRLRISNRDQIDDVVKKGCVKSVRYRRACMKEKEKRFMNVDEEKRCVWIEQNGYLRSQPTLPTVSLCMYIKANLWSLISSGPCVPDWAAHKIFSQFRCEITFVIYHGLYSEE